MEINDNWLLERARKKKAGAAAASERNAPTLKAGRLGAPFAAQVETLWAALQAETQRQAEVYTTALGDPAALAVTTGADLIEVKAPGGKQVTIQLNRQHQSLLETSRTGGGAMRMGRPRIRFAGTAAGTLSFNFGGPSAAAGSILRRVLD